MSKGLLKQHFEVEKMTFEELKDFMEQRMKLSHIYQPLLIKNLLNSGGSSTIRQMALSFLFEDESQIMYYEKRLKEMPIKVLSKHNIILKEGNFISLNCRSLTLQQKAELKKICEAKIQDYIVAKGLSIWDYRLMDESPISDVMRLRLLAEAKGRCALCGATKDERPLDIDHIIPRSKGGKTVYENLQVLCSKCNRTKGNKEDKDYRNIVKNEKAENCVFCIPNRENIIIENDHAYAIKDIHPVTIDHTLVIPKRHFADYFEASRHEQNAISDILNIRRKALLEVEPTIKGFNVGVNSGAVAGQTIFHCHVHLIPRRIGDTPNPRGGVRGVIPNKMNYV